MNLKKAVFWIIYLVYFWSLGWVLGSFDLSVLSAKTILIALVGAACGALYVVFYYPRGEVVG